MLQELKPLLENYNNDRWCKFVIISANTTDRAFCSGGDIKQFASYHDKPGGVNPFIKNEYKIDYLIHTFSKPIISFVNGIVMGGGVGLSIHCQFRIISEKVLWAMPENQIGYFPDVGSNYFLSRLGSMGLYIGITGAKLKAKDLIYSKIATHFIPSVEFDRVIDELVNDYSIENERQINFILNKYRKTIPIDDECTLLKNKDSIDACFSKSVVSLQDILERLEDEKKFNLEWSNKTIEIINNNCPMSTAVCFKAIQQATQMSIEDIFTMEIRIGTRLGVRNDIVEGVKRSVIDRTHKAKFSPATINDIDPDQVDKIFSPLNNPNDEFDINF
ncbi:hypothetical protein DICPUDRAFT_87986 [Dictyostelium purpureum]|uniref:Enoyl-CoA hydratase/isomerase domain-containing protein n=1 Tax=Dictyostelium purpureum TaxID=5786 RepID=F0ZLN9_DICPU|nr:uncharacterized protein DICPUDRAFT_87986 [Dictyostelium purpureum]EGC35133.1 hypothetical protein DICPUDRAFT_87986 [Dictyostelium purpureum]|eukprot:XP_003288326.1 hypothetical protein DICPUDRAFT_87986 [Dictyostelium purpureum]